MDSDLGRGASGAEPGPAATPTLPSPIEGEGEWTTALAAFRRADLAKERFGEASRAASAPPGGRSFEEQEALDEKYADFVGAAEAAMLRLLETRAPDLDALAVKIALIADHLVWELSGGEACLAWLEADARRLALVHGRQIRYTAEA